MTNKINHILKNCKSNISKHVFTNVSYKDSDIILDFGAE
jgi:hypothetical protein